MQIIQYCTKAKLKIRVNHRGKYCTELMLHNTKVKRYKCTQKIILDECKDFDFQILIFKFDFGKSLTLSKLTITDQNYKRLL